MMTIDEYRQKHPDCEYCNHRIPHFSCCLAINKYGFIEQKAVSDMARYIDADALMQEDFSQMWNDVTDQPIFEHIIEQTPTADVVEVDKVAEMLRLMFKDDCACNYNGNDEWLPSKCKYSLTDDCPMPKERLGCWKEFVKHFLAKMDGKE